MDVKFGRSSKVPLSSELAVDKIGSKVGFSGGHGEARRRRVIFSDRIDRRDTREFLKVTRAFNAPTFPNIRHRLRLCLGSFPEQVEFLAGFTETRS